MKKIVTLLALLFALLLCGCCTTHKYNNPQDPYEAFNRKAFAFNQSFDKHLLEPVAKTYNYILFPQVRSGVTNFFNNIHTTSIIANDILQGDLAHTISDSWRLVINSTLGIGGIFDLASHMTVPIAYHYNDFGLTMVHYGVIKSEFLVIPFYGPSTARDGLGMLLDYYAFTPYAYLSPIQNRIAFLAPYYLNTRARLLKYDDFMSVAALDPYTFQKNAFLQRRRYLIKQLEEANDRAHSTAGHSEAKPFLVPTHGWRIQKS